MRFHCRLDHLVRLPVLYLAPIMVAAAIAAAQQPASQTPRPPRATDDPAARITETATEALAIDRAAQARLDDWAAERADLQARWDAARAQVQYLEERTVLQRQRVEALAAAGDELARRLEESRRLETSLEDTLLAILGRLDAAVARDLPFLAAERARRLEAVRADLSDPGATPADKLRRVLEAVLIEARYGGACEIYQDRIEVGGEELTCDLLFVGRLGLFWLTPDAVRGGIWDAGERAFVERFGRELDVVRRAAEIAARRRPADVQLLPLGRVAP
ncbi:MAG: DUF3450 domain-containing protein [Candidatus Krumholzibacteria bacterium]|jgi:hypothetical protein|nr:DUF3450 domain-containing protein [Candidatus Krumholzibacteria bacterium]